MLVFSETNDPQFVYNENYKLYIRGINQTGVFGSYKSEICCAKNGAVHLLADPPVYVCDCDVDIQKLFWVRHPTGEITIALVYNDRLVINFPSFSVTIPNRLARDFQIGFFTEGTAVFAITNGQITRVYHGENVIATFAGNLARVITNPKQIPGGWIWGAISIFTGSAISIYEVASNKSGIDVKFIKSCKREISFGHNIYKFQDHSYYHIIDGPIVTAIPRPIKLWSIYYGIGATILTTEDNNFYQIVPNNIMEDLVSAEIQGILKK